MSNGGKGSQRRPGEIPQEAWDRIFGKKCDACGEKASELHQVRDPLSPDDDDCLNVCELCHG